jgi:hypothetical protein
VLAYQYENHKTKGWVSLRRDRSKCVCSLTLKKRMGYQ